MGRPATRKQRILDAIEVYLRARQADWEAQDGAHKLPTLPTTRAGKLNATALCRALAGDDLKPTSHDLYDEDVKRVLNAAALRQGLKPLGSQGDAGEDEVARLEAYIESVDALPERNGKISVTVVSLATGIATGRFYKDPELREMLEKAATEKGLRPIESQPEMDGGELVRQLQAQVNELSKQLTATRAELHRLRQENRRFQRLQEHMLRTGRLPGVGAATKSDAA